MAIRRMDVDMEQFDLDGLQEALEFVRHSRDVHLRTHDAAEAVEEERELVRICILHSQDDPSEFAAG